MLNQFQQMLVPSCITIPYYYTELIFSTDENYQQQVIQTIILFVAIYSEAS